MVLGQLFQLLEFGQSPLIVAGHVELLLFLLEPAEGLLQLARGFVLQLLHLVLELPFTIVYLHVAMLTSSRKLFSEPPTLLPELADGSMGRLSNRLHFVVI